MSGALYFGAALCAFFAYGGLTMINEGKGMLYRDPDDPAARKRIRDGRITLFLFGAVAVAMFMAA